MLLNCPILARVDNAVACSLPRPLRHGRVGEKDAGKIHDPKKYDEQKDCNQREFQQGLSAFLLGARPVTFQILHPFLDLFAHGPACAAPIMVMIGMADVFSRRKVSNPTIPAK